MQEFAEVDVQVNVLVSPLLIVDGLALNEIVGAGGRVTPIVTEFVVLPPGPVHVIVYGVGEDKFGVTNVPDKG